MKVIRIRQLHCFNLAGIARAPLIVALAGRHRRVSENPSWENENGRRVPPLPGVVHAFGGFRPASGGCSFNADNEGEGE